jgi:hypothetical protein
MFLTGNRPGCENVSGGEIIIRERLALTKVMQIVLKGPSWSNNGIHILIEEQGTRSVDC